LKDEAIDLNADEIIEDQVYHGTGELPTRDIKYMLPIRMHVKIYVKIFLVRIELKSGSSNYGGVIQTSNGKEIKFTSTSLADKKALQVGDNVCYQHGIHQTTGLVRAVNVQERSKPSVNPNDCFNNGF